MKMENQPAEKPPCPSHLRTDVKPSILNGEGYPPRAPLSSGSHRARAHHLLSQTQCLQDGPTILSLCFPFIDVASGGSVQGIA